MSNFACSFPYTRLLDISKQHREAVDENRVYDGQVVGMDNQDNLFVSTMFAAISIEAALNDYTLIHCVFVENAYLQEIFGEFAKRFLSGSIQNKLNLVANHWPDPFPDQILKDVRELIRIRNRITHQTGEFVSAAKSPDKRSRVTIGSGVMDSDLWHMLRHYEIAKEFLSLFYLPGDRVLKRGQYKEPPA